MDTFFHKRVALWHCAHSEAYDERNVTSYTSTCLHFSFFLRLNSLAGLLLWELTKERTLISLIIQDYRILTEVGQRR